ncbi:MAG: hypothetical protein FWE50_04510 [Alphaproteobacteria bacterium]|nr:hypothetical protein [Alphaproteobacteria bacterium]
MKRFLPLVFFALSFSSCETYNYITEDNEKVNVQMRPYKTVYTVTNMNDSILWRNVDNHLTNRVYGIDNFTKCYREKKVPTK